MSAATPIIGEIADRSVAAPRVPNPESDWTSSMRYKPSLVAHRNEPSSSTVPAGLWGTLARKATSWSSKRTR